MTASEKLIAFIRNTFDTALYFAVMAVKENFRNYIRRAGPTGHFWKKKCKKQPI